MEIFKGKLGEEFRQWLEKIQDQEEKIVVISKNIVCGEAQRRIRGEFFSYQSWLAESFLAALIHLISCDNPECKSFLHQLFQRKF